MQPSSSAPAPDRYSQEWYAACTESWTGWVCITTESLACLWLFCLKYMLAVCASLFWNQLGVPALWWGESSPMGVKCCWTGVAGRLGMDWVLPCAVCSKDQVGWAKMLPRLQDCLVCLLHVNFTAAALLAFASLFTHKKPTTHFTRLYLQLWRDSGCRWARVVCQ